MDWYKTSQFNYEVELTDLLRKMAKLDSVLTGKNWQTVTQQAWHYRDKFKDPEYMFSFVYGSDIYYLSDGGYSRVVVDDQSGKLFPTSNSLDRVKNNWKTDEAQVVIKDIENDIATIRSKFDESEDFKKVIEVIKK